MLRRDGPGGPGAVRQHDLRPGGRAVGRRHGRDHLQARAPQGHAQPRARRNHSRRDEPEGECTDRLCVVEYEPNFWMVH